ncbi:hypothetical protein D3C71_1188100 [compost metagenome]
MYTRFVVNPNPKREGPILRSDLDFFNPDTTLWYLPCSLYSAGQAAKSEGAAKRKDMITGRTNSNTTVLGDSGGFQIQQGSIKFKGDVTRQRMMEWLEDNCDWSMILDFPTGGINMGTIDVHYDRLVADGDTYEMDVNGTPTKLTITDFAKVMNFDLGDLQQRGFATCMFQTLVNNVYFTDHRRPGMTNFLNVVQGRTIEESNSWYEQVKRFGKTSEFGDRAFEGWSLAGPHKEKFDMTLTRLLAFRRDGLLEGKNWMHILGVGKLANGCAYTTMQRAIRKYDNPDFTISYDVSSPFTTAAYGNLFLGYTLDKNSWTIQSEKMDGREYLAEYQSLVNTNPIKRKNAHGKDEIVPYKGDNEFLDELKLIWDDKFRKQSETFSTFVRTEIGQRLKMKDVCVNTDPDLTSTWDVVTYAYLMNHNVQVHLEGVFESQDLYDKGDVDRVPLDMLMMKEAIEEILDPATKNPLELIEKHRDVLNCLAGDKVTAGVLMTGALDQLPIPDHNKQLKNMKEVTKIKPVELKAVEGLF